MKPLVNYCRWERAGLRLRGRSETAVWGELVFAAEDGTDETKEFRFNLHKSELTLRQENGDLLIRLDEMGVPIKDA